MSGGWNKQLLALDARIKAEGSWDGSLFTASKVEFERYFSDPPAMVL